MLSLHSHAHSLFRHGASTGKVETFNELLRSMAMGEERAPWADLELKPVNYSAN